GPCSKTTTLKPACDNSLAITPPAAPDPTMTKSTVSLGLNVRLVNRFSRRPSDGALTPIARQGLDLREMCQTIFYVANRTIFAVPGRTQHPTHALQCARRTHWEHPAWAGRLILDHRLAVFRPAFS